MTEEEIEAGRSTKGGFTKEHLAKWGVPWPPPKGWKEALLAGETMQSAGLPNLEPSPIRPHVSAHDLLRKVVLAVVEHGHASDLYEFDDVLEWQPEDLPALLLAIQRLERELPGWWWSVGACHVSADASIGPINRPWAHASIGPDNAGSAAHLLESKLFDGGFHYDLCQPATCAEALNGAIDDALAALAECRVTFSDDPASDAVSLNQTSLNPSE